MAQDSTEAEHMDLMSLDDSDLDDDQKEELWENRGGHSTPVDADVDYTLSSNVAYDLIKYIRSNTIRNEQQFLLVVLGYLTGYFTEADHYVSGVLIGTSSSGKTHVQAQVENLFPKSHMYQATTGSDKSLIYDGDWDKAHIASLDELQKPSETLIEFLKSVHGDDEQFEYKLTPDSAEKRENEEVETIIRTAKPYWFLFAQTDADFEMWNRLLKVPVHESKSKNKMVGALSHDHYYVRAEDEDTEYGFDFDEGTTALQSHIGSIAKNVELNNIPGRVFIPNGDPQAFERSGSADAAGRAGFEWDSYEVLEPIYNHGRSESNRVYDMVTNLIRASALLNYKNRSVQYLDVPNHEAGEYIIAEPQDVANVLRCRESLLATTHELDDKRRKICSAIENETGGGNEADMKTIVNALEDSDMSMLSRNELRVNLEKLHENYLIDINQGAADGGADTYTFHGWGELGFARIFRYEELFEDCFDPISGDNFITAHEELRKKLEDSGQDLTKGADTDVSSGTGGQQTLGGGSKRRIELEPHEEVIRQLLKETLDGRRITNLAEVPVEGMLGITDPDDPERDVPVDGTPLDPSHGCWYQPDKPDDWVETERDAKRHVKEAIRSLIEKRVIIYDEVHEVNKKSEPVDVTFAVLGEQDL